MSAIPTNFVDNIGMFVNAAYLNNLGLEVNANTNARPRYGILSARPAANTVTAGTPYYCSENDVLYRSDGTNWIKVRIGGDSCDTMGDVPTSGWTAVNMQAGASFAADKDAMLFTIPSSGSTNFQYQYRAYPATPFTLTTYIDVAQAGLSTTGWSAGGIIISDGTKLIALGPQYGASNVGNAAAGWNAWASKYSNASTFSAVLGDWHVDHFGSMPKWYRVFDDGTTLSLLCSVNGIDWSTLGSEPRTTFLTPSRIGLGGANSTGKTLLMRVRSWNGIS